MATWLLGITHTYLTRTDDSLVNLYERTRIAAAHNADLFVSIHVDEFSQYDRGLRGDCVLPPRGQTRAARLRSRSSDMSARSACLRAAARYPTACSTRAAWRCCASATMPATLVECGFLTNPNDRKALVTDEYQVKIAKAIASGCAAI